MYIFRCHYPKSLCEKVLAILGIQLLVTLGILSFLRFCEPVRNGISSIDSTSRLYFIVTSIVVQFVIIIILACFRKLRRHSSTKYIILPIFTIIMALWLSCTDVLAIAGVFGLGVLAVICFSLLLFNVATNHNFKVFPQLLFSVIMCTILFVILALTKFLPIDLAGYASLVALCFYGLLILDIWLMVKEKHLFSISPEEYIFASQIVYLDVIIVWVILWENRCTLFQCGK